MITEEAFTEMALSFSGTIRTHHFERLGFKVTGKRMFATYLHKNNTVNIFLTLSEQVFFCTKDTKNIYPVPNKWGENGATTFELDLVAKELILEALSLAYNKIIKPKSRQNLLAQMEIRHALDSDAGNLSQMIYENAKAVLYPHYNEDQWAVFIKYYSPEVMLEKINEQDIFCAEINSRIVGTIALDKNFVAGFYTRLQYMNQGIGKRMMKHIEAVALEKGLHEIQLASSPEGLSFYFKNGWEKIKDFTIEHYGIGFEETLMVKKLTGKVLQA